MIKKSDYFTDVFSGISLGVTITSGFYQMMLKNETFTYLLFGVSFLLMICLSYKGYKVITDLSNK